MNCPYCKEPIIINEIQCPSCDRYYDKDHVQFTVHQPSRHALRYMMLGLAGVLFCFAIVLLLLYLSKFIPPLMLIVAALAISILIFALNSSSTAYDCPNCRAQKSILVKRNMIKSHCKYCGEKYKFTPSLKIE